jgi:hypothetical protein
MRAVSAASRTWAEYGRARLLTELLALRALSASADELEQVFPDPQRTLDSDHGFRLNSALFEYPLEEIGQTALHRRLLELMPEPGRPDPVMQDEARRRVAALSAEFEAILSRDVLPETYLDFEPAVGSGSDAFRHADPPDFRVTPPVEKFAGLVASCTSAVRPARAADWQHSLFFDAIRRCTSDEAIHRQIDRGLREGATRLAKARGDIEVALRTMLSGQPRHDPMERDGDAARRGGDESSPGSSHVVTQTIAFLDLAGDALARPRPATTSTSPDTALGSVLEQARALRQRWCERESVLLRRGAELPSVSAILLEAGSIFLGAFTILGALLVVGRELELASLVNRLGGAALASATAAMLLAWWRNRANVRQLADWQAFEREMRTEANEVARALVTSLNDRLRYMRSGATKDVATAVGASRTRLSTEVAGFAGMLQDALALLEQRERQGATAASEVNGRFRLLLSNLHALEVDEARFHRELAALLERALTLTQLPAPVTLEDYEELVTRQMEYALRLSDALTDAARRDAVRALVSAAGYGWDDQMLALAGSDGAQTAQRFAMVGPRIADRVDLVAAKPEIEAASPDNPPFWMTPERSRASRHLPSEIAIFIVRERWDRSTAPVAASQ